MMVTAAVLAGCGSGKEAANTSPAASAEAQASAPEASVAAAVVKTGMLSPIGKEVSQGNIEIKDGKLMLTNFKTSEGPDLHIYLAKEQDIATGKSLGKIDLKQSEQTFDLAGADPEEYDSVVIYCNKAHVAFGAANLSDGNSADGGTTTSETADTTDTTVAMVKTGMLSPIGKEVSQGNIEIKDGKLMLTNFKTSEGPDLHIYLAKGQDIATGKSLGKIDLKQSEQTFDLAGADPGEYDSVVIYCNKAHVAFGAADLK